MAQPATKGQQQYPHQARSPGADGVLVAADAAGHAGRFLFGYDTSNIGSALNFVPYDLKGLALGYLVSGASLGAAAGAIAAGPIADRFGRKTLLVVDAGIYAVGSILSAVTGTPRSC